MFDQSTDSNGATQQPEQPPVQPLQPDGDSPGGHIDDDFEDIPEPNEPG